jgi:ubiquinone/menaquinone biosynthesis C-methylase UbiE
MLRSALCYQISKAMMKPPPARNKGADAYSEWRDDEMANSWQHFTKTAIDGKDVLDFGCGEGPLSLYLASISTPRSIVGVDIDAKAIDRANIALAHNNGNLKSKDIEFKLCDTSGLPVADQSADIILAFDCMEHVMDPKGILSEWHRVLRPGGRVLIEWFPFKGPFGPHMNSMVPVPWAHVLFGEKAIHETAARIYDHPDFIPRHWDLDENGEKLPNKWTKANTFREHGYLNELSIPQFRGMVGDAGFTIVREDLHGFGDGGVKGAVGSVLLNIPLISEYFVNYAIIELQA